jgi:mono/diheme cytochrome c family protein
MRTAGWALLGAILALALATAVNVVAAQEPILAAGPAGIEFFEKRIRPLLAEHCYQCHGPERQRSGLRLDSRGAMFNGGDRGPALEPGEPEQSRLIQAVRYNDDLRMPPKGKLKDSQIAELVAWVKMGAPRPKDDGLVTNGRPAEAFDLAERRKHWAYQPVRPGTLPVVKNSNWCTSPIDSFILARLEAAGLTPTPPADKRTLIRRVTFDLTGLPPTPQEVEAFLADRSADAYEKVVDRLLASPHYGERWARHWLDLTRYAETLGFEFDYDLYNAWRYRDYVIRALNADLPYDRFVVEHLAGDLLPEPRRHPTEGFNESILATGFFWMGEGKQTPVDIRQEQADKIDNQIDVLGKAFLSQTLACARCHDHKFDAISTGDYYALAGYLKSSRYQQAFVDPPNRITAKVQQLAALKAEVRDLVASGLAGTWLTQAEKTSRYLQAARQVMADEPGGQAAPEETAREFDLDTARLERWVKALRLKETAGADHPLHAWVRMGDTAANQFQQRCQTLRATLRKQADQAARAAASVQRFEDFLRPTFEGWYVTGDAFGLGPARSGDILLGSSPERPVARFVSGGAHSGLLSERLQGELSSRTFTIDKRYIHYRLAGRNARVNLVIDGYTLIMNPIYGKLTVVATGEQPTWWTMPVDRWLGHRAYIEVSDSRIPMHGLNPPPSTARVPEGPGDGHVILDQVLFSDDADPPPAVPNRLNLQALDPAREDNPKALADAYQELIVQEVKQWQSGKTTADGVALLNWLLQNGLLDDAPEVKDKGTGRQGDRETRRGGPVAHSGRMAELLQRYHEIEATLPAPLRAPALADGTGEDEFIFLRGNYNTLGERMPRRPPEVIAGSERTIPAPGSGRLELAHRLVAPSNPLLARVLVNRLWQHHFAEGIVRTPDDFGRMGQPPTHPELLDYLASEFVRRGWSIKAMHRLMLLSSSYRQGSRAEGKGPEQDPENRLLYRMPIRRLEGEAVRDAILAISGRLDRTLCGPSVPVYLTPYMEGRGRPSPGPLDGDGRRSIYLNARRNFLTPLLQAFDYPTSFTTIGRRGVSTVPAQALALMNDPFVVQQAGRWAERALAEPGKRPGQRVEALYQAAFARPPSEAELCDALQFVERQAGRYGAGPDDARAWADLCHVLINVKEFIFID